MQKIIAMLNGTLQVMAAGSERSITRLKEIEKSLVGASKIDDIVALKARLTDCLAFVRTETVRGREELSRTLTTVEDDFRRAQEVLLFCSQGTPGRPEAEQFLTELSSRTAGTDWFVAVFVIRHFELVAKRYGTAVADQLLLEFVRQRLHVLARTASIFRWARDSVVVVIQRIVSLPDLQMEISESVSPPLDYKTPVGDRVAVLTISSKWVLWQGTAPPIKELIEKIDSFTGSSDGSGD
jgi:GGDEF domain-containing protein